MREAKSNYEILQLNSNKNITTCPSSLCQLYMKQQQKSDSLLVSSSSAISRNLNRTTILWNVGLIQYTQTIYKAICHARYRGVLWYDAKQRLYSK